MAGHEPLVVYTDGSCLRNPGPGGWAWAVPGGRSESGGEVMTTNQRMEITAALKALTALREDAADRPIVVVSDSTYVVKCFVERWWERWLQRGWRNAAGKPVANRDLWEPLFAVALRPDRPVTFRWVKGHSGDPWNEVVDEMAVAAAEAKSSA
jgi:ribonuclease HI